MNNSNITEGFRKEFPSSFKNLQRLLKAQLGSKLTAKELRQKVDNELYSLLSYAGKQGLKADESVAFLVDRTNGWTNPPDNVGAVISAMLKKGWIYEMFANNSDSVGNSTVTNDFEEDDDEEHTSVRMTGATAGAGRVSKVKLEQKTTNQNVDFVRMDTLVSPSLRQKVKNLAAMSDLSQRDFAGRLIEKGLNQVLSEDGK